MKNVKNLTRALGSVGVLALITSCSMMPKVSYQAHCRSMAHSGHDYYRCIQRFEKQQQQSYIQPQQYQQYMPNELPVTHSPVPVMNNETRSLMLGDEFNGTGNQSIIIRDQEAAPQPFGHELHHHDGYEHQENLEGQQLEIMSIRSQLERVESRYQKGMEHKTQHDALMVQLREHRDTWGNRPVN